MDSDWKGEEGKREHIQKIILNRGRRVDLHRYLLNHPNELLRGVLIAGSVGSGKTERAISVVKSALDIGYGVVVFDPSNDYQRLLHEYKDGVVIDFSEFYQNPLTPPPGMTLEEWSPVFIQVLAQIFGLKDPSIAILQSSMENLITDSKEEIPIISELLKEVVEFRPRSHSSETSSHASVQNRLESILKSEWGRCLDVREGFSPEDFEEGLLIVKLRSAGIERVYEFVVGITIAKLFAYRSWKQNLGEPLGKNVLVVIEEAHRFLSQARQGDRRGRTLFLERALVESRKLGVGFVTVDQMPHRISDYVLGSCNMWIVCRLMDPNSRRMVGEALRTDIVWSHIGLMELPVGGAIIRVENQQELEETSPLAHRDEKFLYDSKGLPATVALPANSESLLPLMESSIVLDMMVKNERYMRYFKRVLMQDYHRIKDALKELEKREILKFIDSMTNADSENQVRIETPNVSTSMNRYQIDECAKVFGTLSSKNKLKLLKVLIDTPGVRGGQLADVTSMSPSWISRTAKEMSTSGIIQRNKGEYSITAKGWKLLTWAQSLGQESEIEDVNPVYVEVNSRKLEWTLSRISELREIKEMTTIAGRRGSQEELDELCRLEYILHYILRRGRIESINVDDIDCDFFQLMKTAIEGDVLSQLMAQNRPVQLRSMIKHSALSDRSIRRLLASLERYGVTIRIWHEGRRGVRIQSPWHFRLRQLVENQDNRLVVPISLINRMLGVVRNSILHDWLLSGKEKSDLWDTFVQFPYWSEANKFNESSRSISKGNG